MSSAGTRVVERTRLRARRLVKFMEALWASEATSADQGLSISPGEVRRHLVAPDEQARARDGFFEADQICVDLGHGIRDADEALANDAYWTRIVSRFELSGLEADLLCAATALSAAPELGRVFAYLADDVTAVLPSLALARILFDRDSEDFCDCAALRRWRLAEADQSVAIPALAGWRASDAVARSLAETRWSDPAIAPGALKLMPPGWSGDLPVVQPAALKRAGLRLDSGRSADLAGATGSGRATLAAKLAASRGERLLIVDTRALLASADEPADALIGGLRMARLENALACFVRAAAAPAAAWRRILSAGVPVVRCFDPGEVAEQEVAAITLVPIALPERLLVWRHLSDAPVPADITSARLTAGEIARLAKGGERDGADEPVPELLTRLPTPYEWSDLVLPADSEAALRDFSGQVRLRGEVLEGWGFERLSHLGSGLVALFSGPSGVGKTMAAQVLARDLGLELFRIDLAGVVDKYIGETEKRLRAAFAFAERPGVLLMFDEADALFGSRLQAKDSHDRYANLEINYLLQRIETFDGIAVLATNRKGELDNAFRRRLRTMVDFLQPGPAERLKLWSLALPDEAPGGEPITDGIDREMLAEKLSLSGADIKAAALGAAFLARAEGTKIAMRHVLAATQREMAKHGHAMRLPLVEASAR